MDPWNKGVDSRSNHRPYLYVPISTIYFDGVCKCPNATVGETATISGTVYTVVDNTNSRTEVAADNFNLCISL